MIPRTLVSTEQQISSVHEELREINELIEQAEDLRDRYLSEAARAEDQGMRWQFMQNQKQEARKAFQRAEEKKQAAQAMQERIDGLNQKKQELLRQHPELQNV